MKDDDENSSTSSSSEISLSFEDEFNFETITTKKKDEQLTTNEGDNNSNSILNNNVKQQQEEDEYEIPNHSSKQKEVVVVDDSKSKKDTHKNNNNNNNNQTQRKTPASSSTTKLDAHESDDNKAIRNMTKTDTGSSKKRTPQSNKKSTETVAATTVPTVAATTTEKIKRPKQPPNPPKSLIKLIQKDKLVLKYFQSLQENLQADVTVWKERATKYQQDTIQLQQQLDQIQRSIQITKDNNNNNNTNEPTTKRKRKNSIVGTKNTKLIKKISKNTISTDNNQDEYNVDDDDDDDDKADNDSNDKELCTNVVKKDDGNKDDNKDSASNNIHHTDWNQTNQPVDDTLFDDMSSSESDNDNDNIISSKKILPKQQQQQQQQETTAVTRPSSDDPKNDTSSLIHESDFDFDDNDNDDDTDDESKQSSKDEDDDSSSKHKCKGPSNNVLRSKKKSKKQKLNGFLNFASSDDDDNDSDEENDVSTPMNTIKNKTFVVQSGTKKQHDDNNKETNLISSILVQTYTTLMQLGITLVTTNTSSGSSSSKYVHVDPVPTTGIPNHDAQGTEEGNDENKSNSKDNVVTPFLENGNLSKKHLNSINALSSVDDNDDIRTDNDDDDDDSIVLSKQQNRRILRNDDEDVAANILHYIHSEFVSSQKQRNQHKLIVATNNNIDDDNDNEADDVDISNLVESAVVNDDKEERENKNFSLFSKENLLPFYYPPSNMASDVSTCNATSNDSTHPIICKMRLIFNVLTSFETLCSPLVPQDEWKLYFSVLNYEKTNDGSMQDAFIDKNNDNDDDHVDDVNEKQTKSSSSPSKDEIYSMTVGLRGRYTLVVQLVKSLEGELIEGWACTDRALHFTAAASAITDTNTIEHDDYYDNADDQDDSLLDKDTNDDILLEKDRDEMHVGKPKNKFDVMCVTVKSQTRISTLFERCTLSQLVIGMILNRNQTCYAFYLLLSYIHSTVPATKVEQSSSNWPPVCSLLIVEAMIRVEYMFPNRSSRETNEGEINGKGITWFQNYLETEVCAHRREWILMFMKNTFDSVANTFQKRKHSSIEHIRDVAFIELACYERLVAMFQPLYTKYSTSIVHDEFFDRILPLMLLQGHSIDDVHKSHHEESPKEHEINCTVLAQSGLVLLYSNLFEMQRFFHDIISQILDSDSEYCLEQYSALLYLVPVAIRQVGIRQMDQLRHNTFLRLVCHVTIPIIDLWSIGSIVSLLLRKMATKKMMNLFPYVVKLLLSIANAEHVFESVSIVVEAFHLFDESAKNQVYQLFQETTSIPVVRVVNLRKRQDRFAAFVAQAIREKFTIVKAVVPFRDDNNDEIVHDYNQPKTSTNGIEWGCHAFDGTLERLTDAYDYLKNLVGSQDVLNTLVLPHWCPNNIKAFDTNAPSSPHLVRTTPTEVACALSHLSSWKGVVRSLNPLQRRNNNHVWTSNNRELNDCVKTALNRLVLLHKISGFAQGPAVFEKNRHMSPTPVCIILEDDAIVCDDFNNRLDSLLKELPRDFHFCSLGYSRPKTAPIVPYSTEIGIPTMLWYLTGYVLSYDGAKYLLDSLPIEGPVDTFIGLKMTNNWDNSYGVALGVGNRVNPVSELPSRKHLADILQFRAFCAMNPLCTQKAPASIFNKANDRSWRKRDTDIEYSGYSAPIHRSKK